MTSENKAPVADHEAEIARLTAERDRFEAALGRACLVGGTTYLLDRAEKAEARGRVKGMRDAAGMFHEEQVRIWAEEILSSLALEGILSFGTYDKKVTAYVSVSNEINGISSAILARADQIEKEGGASVQTGARINDHQRN